MRRTARLVVAAALAGCGGRATVPDVSPAPSAPAAAPVPTVPGIAAEGVRLRTDEAVGGRIQVRITNTGDEPLTVTGVALDAPGFAPLAATPVTAVFAPDG